MRLSTLGLSLDIIKALRAKGYSEPTPIQSRLIPAIMSGRDILAGATTGTGKSAGFILPILERIMEERKEWGSHYTQALIIAPTRELVKQLADSTRDYSQFLPITSMALYGGTPISSQKRRLSEGVDIVISTPGRLLEHITQRSIDLDGVGFFVLDEADTIFDMGFRGEISQIIRELTPKRQNILISATISPTLKEISHKLLHRPLQIEVDKMGKVAQNIKQVLYLVESSKKLELLSYLIGSRNYKQVLVFVRKKGIADEVSRELIASGLKSATIHGDKSIGARSRALLDFKEGRVRVLVATDIAARGLDIKGLDVVISYDIPHVTQDYIHRIGRTGRANRDGLAIVLSTPEESVALRDVEKMLGESIDRGAVEGYISPKVESKRGARAKKEKRKEKIAGAYGNKKKSKTTTKKRKTTKRDRWG